MIVPVTPNEDRAAEANDLRRSYACLAIVAFGIGLTEPVLPLFALDLGAGPVLAGAVVAVRWGVRLLIGVPAGLVVARFGPCRTTAAGVAALVVAAIVTATAREPEALLLARIFEGVGAGLTFTSILVAVAQSTDARGARLRRLGHYQSLHRIGLWFGPAAGGLIAAGWGLRRPMQVFAVLAVVAAIVASGGLRRGLVDRGAEAVHPAQTWDALRKLPDLLRCRNFIAGGVITGAAFFTLTGTQFTALPLLIGDELRLSPAFLGICLFVMNAMGFAVIYPASRLTASVGYAPVIAALLALTAIGLVLLSIVSLPWALVVVSGIVGVGSALRGATLQAAIFEAAPDVDAGLVAGTSRAVGDLGATLGPLAVGIAAVVGTRWFFVFNSLLLAASMPFAKRLKTLG